MFHAEQTQNFSTQRRHSLISISYSIWNSNILLIPFCLLWKFHIQWENHLKTEHFSPFLTIPPWVSMTEKCWSTVVEWEKVSRAQDTLNSVVLVTPCQLWFSGHCLFEPPGNQHLRTDSLVSAMQLGKKWKGKKKDHFLDFGDSCFSKGSFPCVGKPFLLPLARKHTANYRQPFL